MSSKADKSKTKGNFARNKEYAANLEYSIMYKMMVKAH